MLRKLGRCANHERPGEHGGPVRRQSGNRAESMFDPSRSAGSCVPGDGLGIRPEVRGGQRQLSIAARLELIRSGRALAGPFTGLSDEWRPAPARARFSPAIGDARLVSSHRRSTWV